MIIERIDFKQYCFSAPFSSEVLNDFESSIQAINPQDCTQIRVLLNQASQLPINNIHLINVPNKLTVIVFQTLDSDNDFNFGFFESINDQELVTQCFEFIESEFVKEAQLIGPINFSTFFKYRLKLNCFDRPSFLGEPNNLSYYPDLLEGCGFIQDKTYHSQYSSAQALDVIIKHELDRDFLQQAKSMFTITSISKENIKDYVKDIYELVLGQFSHKSQFNPITLELFESLYIKEILPYIHSEYSHVYYADDQLAGFNFMFDHKKYAQDNKLECGENCSDLIYKTVCVHKAYQGKGLFKLMNANTLSKYPHGISTTGATMENSQFVLNYSNKYGEVKTIDYALYKKCKKNI